MNIKENILELIGNTPLVQINKLNTSNSKMAVKLEYFNPANSVKDRPANYMIEVAEKEGLINRDTVIIEPTSGNTGIGLALTCAVKGYKMILTMPESMSLERRKMLKGYGAELVLTPKELGMKGAVDKAHELAKQYSNSFIPSQFDNPNNPKIHELTTAEEIFRDTDGKIDVFVAGIGTGGTLSGTGKRLKELKPSIKVIGVEPFESPLITKGEAGSHGIQGIGANFVPKNYMSQYVDEVITVKTADAIETAKRLATEEGILCGISSGAAFKASLDIANSVDNKLIVTLLPDFGERYISTALFE